MAGGGPGRPPQVIPYLYYPDATEAVDFLRRAFGFQEVSAFRDEEGTVWTATLRLGSGAVMVGPGLDGFGTMAVPEDARATSRMFVLVDDVDAHCERARAAGATILSEVAEHPGGNRQYVARDCGRQQWIFAAPIEKLGGEDSNSWRAGDEWLRLMPCRATEQGERLCQCPPCPMSFASCRPVRDQHVTTPEVDWAAGTSMGPRGNQVTEWSLVCLHRTRRASHRRPGGSASPHRWLVHEMRNRPDGC